ncbi:hypothetical protein [Pseudoalteromonas sp. MelDa3]|uniref:hypothetical protein n=1 Tax=Pseudoalteromonas sp. MelDa3 TaxID=888435 RepID=UPI000CB851FD|nr:hypothetical protein [Pseudoalteromonas sp. MelDa3]PLT27052.1 hypothetical protein CXF89_02115 [Pseudoalteromonas sp. MelDa3]
MSAIANFKKRRLASKAKGETKATTGNAQITITPQNTALKLLAQLLGCDESKEIETAQEYVDQNIKFFCEDDLPTLHVDSEKEQVDVSNVEDATDELNQSIDSASNAAGDIESAADKASDAASDLAYQADDINAANSALADTVEELKKPSAAQNSSNSKKKTEPKNSSKK